MTALDRLVKFFLPREEVFFDLMERGADCARDSGVVMRELCTAPTAEGRAQALARLRDVEHAADAVIRETYDQLNRTFITPIDRSDIYALSTELEEIVDLNHATAMQLVVHAMEDVPQGSAELAGLIEKATEEVAHAVRRLRSFRDFEKVQEHCRHLSSHEHAGDEIFRNTVGNLFRAEKDAVRLIQHKEFLEGLERTLDACDHVGTALKTIVIKNS